MKQWTGWGNQNSVYVIAAFYTNLIQMLEHTEWTTKNGQSRDIDNTGYKSENEDTPSPPKKNIPKCFDDHIR